MQVGTRTGPTPARMLGAMPTEEPEVKRKRGRPPKNSKPLPPASEDPSQLAPKEEEVYEVEAIRAMRMTKVRASLHSRRLILPRTDIPST